MAEVYEVQANFGTTDVAVVTTSETVAISSGEVKLPFESHRIVVIAWCQLTVGAGTTAITPRIRRGTSVTGTLVGEGNAEAVKGAAGSTEPIFMMVSETRSNVESVEYSLTVTQTGATGNGTVVQAGIIVLVM